MLRLRLRLVLLMVSLVWRLLVCGDVGGNAPHLLSNLSGVLHLRPAPEGFEEKSLEISLLLAELRGRLRNSVVRFLRILRLLVVGCGGWVVSGRRRMVAKSGHLLHMPPAGPGASLVQKLLPVPLLVVVAKLLATTVAKMTCL